MKARSGADAELRAWATEWPALAAGAILAAGWAFKSALSAGHMPDALLAFAFAGLFVGALLGAFSAVRHAEHLAHIFGEPYGTLLLTLSVISIEVIAIATVMLHGANDPHIARDTMYSVIMIVLNGVVGLGLLLGGLRHREQNYNLQGANSYLGVLIPLAVLTLIWPDFTETGAPGEFSPAKAVFLIVVSILLYGVFLAVQTMRHRSFFAAPGEAVAAEAPGSDVRRHWLPHACWLVVYLLIVVLTAKLWALPLDIGIDRLGLPEAAGAVALAILVLAPEALAAIKAARENHMQRSVNLALGSALATISLTAPAVLAIDLITGHPVVLGVPPAAALLLALTFGVSILTFSSGRTNMLQGAIHLVLFLVYALLIFSP